MGDTFDVKKFGAVVPLQLSVANAVTNQTNTDLALPGGNTLFTMPAAGSVVGIAVKASANVTAGTATFKAHKAGTEFTDQSALAVQLTSAATNSNAAYGTVRPGVMTFAAGDGIGVSYTSSSRIVAMSFCEPRS